jgi:serine phosphatase RsbU (regulator of sigma subunit)
LLGDFRGRSYAPEIDFRPLGGFRRRFAYRATRQVRHIRNGVTRFSGFSRRTTVTLTLVAGLLAAFAYATWLSYGASSRLFNAFGYESKVGAALNDTSLLAVEQFDRGASEDELGPYERILENDLARIDAVAETPEQRAPQIAFPAKRADYERLTTELLKRESLGTEAFDATVHRNERTRNLSNAMFALVALLFAVLTGRLRRTIEEGRSLVERLQRAFISAKRDIPNVDLGSVLISATRGSNVGGDTHDAFTFDGKRALFIVADVSGKGIEAAVDTALIKYTMRTLFTECADPGVLLAKFEAIYARSAEKTDTFVVMFVAVLDLEDGTLRYASAGHEPAWIVRGGAVDLLPPTGSIVGIAPEDGFATHTLRLAAGDALVVSTDGLTESRDARGRFLGAEGVRDWLVRLTGSAQARADAVVRLLRRRSRRIADDLAILVVRYDPAWTAPAHAAPAAEGAGAPAFAARSEGAG